MIRITLVNMEIGKQGNDTSKKMDIHKHKDDYGEIADKLRFNLMDFLF